MTAATLLFLFLPFLFSLAGKGGTPIVLCLVMSVMAVLRSVDPGGAVLPWCLGMVIAAFSMREAVHARWRR
jgi:hypothetical protein